MSENPIDEVTIAAAERLLGIAYSQSERTQMRDNLGQQIAFAEASRAVRRPNALPPAHLFDPRLRGFTMPAQSAMNVPLAAPALPADDADIAFAPVRHLAAWIAAGQLSSRRLTGIYLERIARIGPAVNAFATVTADLALAQAARADALLAAGTWLGPLHGIPYAAKDLIDTAGITTGWGAEPYADRVPEEDATIVTRLAAAGAVLLGKATLGALAFGDIWYGGTTRNPWNTEEGSRGSSAGSASATAAGLAAFAIGSETLGSIVAPSARCGTVGLRPTFGRVSRAGAMALCWSLDKLGPITRSVGDIALVLSAINGFDAADEGSIDAPFGWDAARPAKGMRAGYIASEFTDPLDVAVLDALLEIGVTPVPIELANLPYEALQNLLFAEGAAAFEDLTLDGGDDMLKRQDPGAWPNSFRKARFMSAVDHIQLDRLRRQTMREMDAVFGRVDVMVAPIVTGKMTIIGNMTGHPGLAVRTGFAQLRTREMPAFLNAVVQEKAGALHTVPHAISILAPLFDEAAALTVGLALEQAMGVASRRPPLG
ncbi:MAG: amidase [Alphaproteobacteria bacterium]|nr:amidase [Alphaproteobacteria bacterium]